MSFNTEGYLYNKREIVNQSLQKYLLSNKAETKLRESVVYSIYPGGKRLRPILCLAASELVCGSYENALPVACAIEMIHTYSIIHDDLPSMDDDDIRRGRSTNHKVFGEAVAILAGDALLTDAFGLISENLGRKNISPELILQTISIISEAAGSQGMVLGQILDLEMDEWENPSVDEITNVYFMKTAKIIVASVLSGATLAGANPEQFSRLEAYSKKLGIAFQIKDDILDVEKGQSAIEDKDKGEKTTFVSLMGIRRSQEMVDELTNQAISELQGFDKYPNPLREIAIWLREREE